MIAMTVELVKLPAYEIISRLSYRQSSYINHCYYIISAVINIEKNRPSLNHRVQLFELGILNICTVSLLSRMRHNFFLQA